jgi:branched-chain amino acid transport system substrate-binding protein
VLSLAILLVLVATACSTSTGSGGGGTKGPIVIGGTLGLTGAFALPSTEYKAVYDRWVEQVNARGGLLGRQVKMVIYNDEGNPTTAQSLYNRLINRDKADLLLAPFTTFVGGAIVPIALTNRKVLFNGGFVGIKLFDQAKGWVVGSYTYQEPDYTKGIFELIKQLPPQDRPTRAAILTAQNPFPEVVRDGYKGQGGALNYARQNGIRVVLNEEYPPSTTDFSGLIQRAKAAGADLFLELGLPNDSLQVARTMYQQGFKPKIACMCGSQVTTLPAWSKLGAPAEGIMGTTISWPTQNFTGLDDLASFYKSRGVDQISVYGEVATAILQVLEQAVEGAKTLDQAKLKDYLLSHTFQTVDGPIRYQPNGTPVYSQLIVQWTKGRNQVVWPSDQATAHAVVTSG